MSGKIVRISDYDRRTTDAVPCRDQAGTAAIIVLPVVRIERQPKKRRRLPPLGISDAGR